ncbi:hypothetical protein LLEC1_03076 [Akanthomyces lecanii]|uniref:Uncharacterized protein n=1 Tax=Cordyceps confragosa TaxID=2714763 RepID=A0A179I1V3_CORDF|nr:hypothetical protein LLEC1_03076 [Akanthomyces lecanii]
MTPTATTSSTSSSSDPGTSSGYTTSNEGPGPDGLDDGVGTELTKKGTIRVKRWTARGHCVVVLPSCDEQIMTPFVGLPPCHGPNRPIFLLDVSSRRIADASKARGKLVRTAEAPHLDEAWAIRSRQMVHVLDFVNKGIADKKTQLSTKQGVLRRIFTLLMFDLVVDAAAWRPHLLGYLALIQHMGGVRAVMRSKNEHTNNTQWTVLLLAIAANSTSPSDQQIRGFEAYTDKDVEFLFSRDVNPDLPCPAPLFVVLKNLNQLRGRIADDNCPKALLERTVRDLFDRVSAFNHDRWAETIAFEAGDLAATMSRIFQVAVRLYGILSLPHSAIVYWAVATRYPRLPGASIYDSVRIAHRRELLDLLYPFRGRFRSLLSLAWPVTVAGVSLGGDGSAEDCRFIAEALLGMWKSPLSRVGPILCLEKLRVFWDSGKTVWDDCFDEPVPPLA